MDKVEGAEDRVGIIEEEAAIVIELSFNASSILLEMMKGKEWNECVDKEIESCNFLLCNITRPSSIHSFS